MSENKLGELVANSINTIDREHIREETRINIINTVGLLSIDWVEAKEIIITVLKSIDEEVESTGSIYKVWKEVDR